MVLLSKDRTKVDAWLRTNENNSVIFQLTVMSAPVSLRRRAILAPFLTTSFHLCGARKEPITQICITVAERDYMGWTGAIGQVAIACCCGRWKLPTRRNISMWDWGARVLQLCRNTDWCGCSMRKGSTNLNAIGHVPDHDIDHMY